MTDTLLVAPSDRTLPWAERVLRSVDGDPYVREAHLTEGDTTRQALKAAELGFTIERIPAVAPEQDAAGGGTMPSVLIENKWFARRTDTGAVLGFLGPDHDVLQPFEMAEFTDLLVDAAGSSMTGVGMTKHDGGPDAQFGAQMYCVVKLDEPIMPNGMPGEATDVYWMLTNAWDSSQSLTGSIIPMRRVCVNGLTYPIKGASLTWRIRHSRTMRQKMELVQESIQSLAGWAETMRIDMEQLLDMTVDEDRVDHVVDSLLPRIKPETNDEGKLVNSAAVTRRETWRDGFYDAWLSSPTISDGIRYTAFGAMNGWTEWKQWGRPDLTMDPMDRLLKQGTLDSELAKVRQKLGKLKLAAT